MIGILFLLAILVYILAPNMYSFVFCALSLAIFIADSVILIRKDRHEKIGFNLLFSLSFFMANYIYPLFVFPILPNFSLFAQEIDSNVITKSTAMATLAYSIYALGYSNQQSKYKRIKAQLPNYLNILNKCQMNIASLIELMLFTFFVSAGGLQMFADAYNKSGNNASPIVSIIYVLFSSFTIFLTIANNNLKNQFVNLLLLIVIILLFNTGTRTLPLMIASVMLCRWCEIHNLSFKKIGLLLLLGGFLLFMIGRIRIGINELPANEELGIISYAEDFIVVNRNLYDIYSHVQKEDITYGVSSLSYILSAIPFAQNLVSKLFGIPDYAMRSETLITYWNLGKDSNLGLGTHIVGDVYLSFGFIGVMVLFYFLGRFIVFSRHKASMGNWGYFVVYYVLISGAIFMCRGSFFYSFKNILWGLFFAFYLKRLYFKGKIIYNEQELS